MHIDRIRLRAMRAARQWSQEQLATLSGLNLRTIQRLESGAKISQESLRALCAVFEVPAEHLLLSEPGPSEPALHAMREGILRGLDFGGGILVLLYLLTYPSRVVDKDEIARSDS